MRFSICDASRAISEIVARQKKKARPGSWLIKGHRRNRRPAFFSPFFSENEVRGTKIADMRVLDPEGNRSLALLPTFPQVNFSERKPVFWQSSHIDLFCPRRSDSKRERRRPERKKATRLALTDALRKRSCSMTDEVQRHPSETRNSSRG